MTALPKPDAGVPSAELFGDRGESLRTAREKAARADATIQRVRRHVIHTDVVLRRIHLRTSRLDADDTPPG